MTSTDLRMAVNAGLEIADQLEQARAALRRIDGHLARMRDLYEEQGDGRAVVLIDTIRRMVIGPELPPAPVREPVPAGVTGLAIGTRQGKAVNTR